MSVDVASAGGYIARPLHAALPRWVGGINAQMAELVDAQVSGTCGRKVVEVRVFSWAPMAASVGETYADQ